MKQVTQILLALAIAITAISCGGRSENRKLKEAAAIHAEIMETHDSIYSQLLQQQTLVQKKLSEVSESDPNYKAYESMQRSIDRSFTLLASWEENVIGVPGMEHDHSGETHHDHDHADDEMMNNLSDSEILELQQAYKARLDEVNGKISELITTMEMYTRDAQ